VSSPQGILGYLSLCIAAQIKISVIARSMVDAEWPVLTQILMLLNVLAHDDLAPAPTPTGSLTPPPFPSTPIRQKGGWCLRSVLLECDAQCDSSDLIGCKIGTIFHSWLSPPNRFQQLPPSKLVPNESISCNREAMH
jgi:hypothetical protein